MSGALRGIADYVALGGWIMLPLGVCSLAMWWLIVERAFALRALARGDIGPREAAARVRGGALPDAGGEGLRARLVSETLTRRRGGSVSEREAVREAARSLRPELRRSLAVIAVLAGVAPLLGLLGTVTGMIETFDVIAAFGTGNARALAGGVSTALVTTQSGLMVAIPGLLAGVALSRRARRLEQRLEETSALLMRGAAPEAAPAGGGS